MTGVTPPELLAVPVLPEAGQHVWLWFLQLTRKRTCGMAMNPITWPDIQAWSILTGIKPKQWELEAINGIDEAFLVSTMKDVNNG